MSNRMPNPARRRQEEIEPNELSKHPVLPSDVPKVNVHHLVVVVVAILSRSCLLELQRQIEPQQSL